MGFGLLLSKSTYRSLTKRIETLCDKVPRPSVCWREGYVCVSRLVSTRKNARRRRKKHRTGDIWGAGYKVSLKIWEQELQPLNGEMLGARIYSD